MFKRIFMILFVVVSIFGLNKLSSAMMCGGKMQEAQAQEPTATSEEKPVEVENKICPVSGEKIDEKTKVTYEYQGKIYNLCCPACIEEFKKDPEKYLQKIEEEKEQQAAEEKTEEAPAGHQGHTHAH